MKKKNILNLIEDGSSTNANIWSAAKIANEIANSSGGVNYEGGYNAATNTPDLTTMPNSVSKGAMYTVTVAGTLHGEALEAGDTIIAQQDEPASAANWTFIQGNWSFGTTAGTACEGNDSRLTPLTDAQIETAYNNQVGAVTQAEAEAGTSTTIKRWTAQRVKQAIDALAGGTPALNNGQVFVGNTSNQATSVAMSGDIAIAVNGATTIQSDSVTYDKMQDTTQAALLGNQSGAGTVSEIPVVEAYLPSGSAIRTLLETTSNWDVNGNYTGSTITGTFQGQSHYDGNYWFSAVDDNVWIRLIRG